MKILLDIYPGTLPYISHPGQDTSGIDLESKSIIPKAGITVV